MNVTVYIVCCVEYNEGERPVSAHTSYIGAHQHAKTFGAREMERISEDQWKWSRSGISTGCDEVWIYRLPVDAADAEPKPVKEYAKQRGACSVCGTVYPLRKDGGTYSHSRFDGAKWAGRCSGSWKAPVI